MSELLTNLNWWAVIISTILSFWVAALWYSPKMFGDKWAEGNKLTKADLEKPMTSSIITQLIATLLLAMLIGVVAKTWASWTIILITAVMLATTFSDWAWANKSRYTIMTDASFTLVSIIIMVIVQTIMG